MQWHVCGIVDGVAVAISLAVCVCVVHERRREKLKMDIFFFRFGRQAGHEVRIPQRISLIVTKTNI